jgi:hypothetical protein
MRSAVFVGDAENTSCSTSATSWSIASITGWYSIDDPVDDRVQRRPGPALEEIRPLLRSHSHAVQPSFAVPHGDDEAVADEDEDLAELDRPVALAVARRLEDDEQRVVERLELRPLVRLDRVLDGELVEREVALHRIELLDGRLVETEPDERVPLTARLGRVHDRQLAGAPAALLVDGAVDDHRALCNGGARRASA